MNSNSLISLTGLDWDDIVMRKRILDSLNEMDPADVFRVNLEAKDKLVEKIAEIWLKRLWARLESGY
jgi:hypothetical protein